MFNNPRKGFALENFSMKFGWVKSLTCLMLNQDRSVKIGGHVQILKMGPYENSDKIILMSKKNSSKLVFA
jgi:hypothetical protein